MNYFTLILDESLVILHSRERVRKYIVEGREVFLLEIGKSGKPEICSVPLKIEDLRNL